VRGTVPMTPTSQNLRFSNRTASVQSPRVATSAGNQRFYGSAAVGARTPFVQQQSAVRTAVGASPAHSSMAAPGRGGANQAAGWGRFEGSPAGRGTPQGNQGTRQFQVSPSIIRQRQSTPAPTAAPAQRGGYSAPAPAPRSAPAGGSNRSSGSHSNGGGRH
jgi:hypothetical protein